MELQKAFIGKVNTILEEVDFEKLLESANGQDQSYAMDTLKQLHQAFVDTYGTDCITGRELDEILNNAGNPVTPDDILDVEICIGRLRKTYRNAEVTYENGFWLFPLSQGESFSLLPGVQNAQVRVVWANGVVEGKRLYGVYVEESLRKEVL